MDWETAAPFYLGALSLALCLPVQNLLDYTFRRDYNSFINDGQNVSYDVPPRLKVDPLSRRFGRDADILSSVAYVASTMSSALVLFDVRSDAFLIALAIGLFLPVTSLAVLLTVDPTKYAKKALFKKHFPIAPFSYIAITASLIVAGVVGLTSPETSSKEDGKKPVQSVVQQGVPDSGLIS